MHCPNCGCELTLESEFCPDCGANFEGMSDNEKKRVFNRPLSTPKKKINPIDPSNVNGYVVEEGRSIKGGKLRKGSATSRGGNRFAGYDTNTAVRREVHKMKALMDKDEDRRPIKLNYEMKTKLEKDILGYDEEEDI